LARQRPGQLLEPLLVLEWLLPVAWSLSVLPGQEPLLLLAAQVPSSLWAAPRWA
jgi:hypothetical protein